MKVIREVDRTAQKTREELRKLFLYEDKVVTKHRIFKIDAVFDMTYRFIGGKGGLLYLHTDKGVFSYMIKESPELFVEVFKELKKNTRA